MFNNSQMGGNDLPSPFEDENTLPSPFDEDLDRNNIRDPIRSVKQWYFIVQEDCANFARGSRIASQFTPQQVQRNLGENIVEGGGFSRESPIIQWVGGILESFTFEARFFSEHSEDNTAAEKLEQLELLRKRDSTLGRPPLLAFFWGIAIPDGFPCLLDSLGTISYDEIRDDGSIRGFTCQITIKRFTEYQIETTPVSQSNQELVQRHGRYAMAYSPERTPVYVAKHGDTYESIAQWRYGDPLLGVLLRQMNGRAPMVKNAPTGAADLKPGEEVKLYAINELQREKIQPLCHVLKSNNRLALENRRRFFELRSTIRAVLPRR